MINKENIINEVTLGYNEYPVKDSKDILIYDHQEGEIVKSQPTSQNEVNHLKRNLTNNQTTINNQYNNINIPLQSIYFTL